MQLHPVAKCETRAVRVAEPLVGISLEDCPGGFLVSWSYAFEPGNSARSQFLAELLRGIPAKSESDQGQGFIEYKIGGKQAPAMLPECFGNRIVVRVVLIDRRVPGAGVDEYPFQSVLP